MNSNVKLIKTRSLLATQMISHGRRTPMECQLHVTFQTEGDVTAIRRFQSVILLVSSGKSFRRHP